MPPESVSDLKFEIGHVLFIDIIGYSKLLITEQSELLRKLTDAVRATEQFRIAEAEDKLVRLPTGDGMALVFRSNPEAPVQCALELSRQLKAHPEVRVRMGVHSGPVNEVADVNARANITGAGINIAQRIMDCGDAGHILLSKRVADDLEQYPQWRSHLHNLGTCEVKHGVQVSVVNLYTDEIGNPELPEKFKKAEGTKSVSAVVSGSDGKGRRRRWLLIGGLTLLLGAAGLLFFPRITTHLRNVGPALDQSTSHGKEAQVPEKSIAVLPFENLSQDAENAYFADGIQEEILTRLSKIGDLKVISRTSTQRYKSRPDNLIEIARQLGVENILEGSVQKAADQVRVNVQLINAHNDSHLWAEKYDRKLTDIFAVESEIARTIAETLQARLSGAEQHAIAARSTENPEAHQAYLKGQYYWYKFPAPGFEKSHDYFQQAVDLDPSYALGYAGLALYYGFAAANGVLPPDENWPKSEFAAKKALTLDDSLADAYNALAGVQQYYYRDWPAAEGFFRRGIERNPNSAEIRHHYALNLVWAGRNEEALAQMQRATELDPLALRNNFDRARIYFFIHQDDRAIDQFRKTLELENFPAGHEWLGHVYARKGMQQDAIAEWSKALSLSGETENARVLESVYAQAGFEAAVRAWAGQRLEKVNERIKRGEYVPAMEQVMAYIGLGDKEQAFAWLAKAAQEHNRFARDLAVNPLFDPLRGDVRFETMLDSLRLPRPPGSP